MGFARSSVIPVAAAERDAFKARTHAVELPAALARTLAGLRDDAGDNAKAAIEAMRRQAENDAVAAQTRAREAAASEAARHTAKWVASVKVATQIDLSRLLADDDLVDVLSLKSEEFVGLIKSLSQDVIYRIEREVLGAIFQGRSNADIARALQEIEGITRARARLIARDQAAKLNSAMNEFRQSQAGVTKYKWKTILDGRERATHRARNGHIYEWANPPPGTGHPGTEIACRCRALAVLEEYDD